MAVPFVSVDDFALATVPTGPDEARGTATYKLLRATGQPLGISLWLLRKDAVVVALEWRVARVARVLSPPREWAKIATEVVLSAVVAASLALILYGIAPGLAKEAEAGIAAITFVVVLIIAPHLLRYSRAGLYRKLDVIAKEADGHGHDVIMEVLQRNLETFSATVKGLKSESGLGMNRAEIIGWTIQCFANARGRYRGADSNVPGQYNTRYPTYLDSHRRMLERLSRPGVHALPGERILVATTEELRHDRVDSGVVFTRFVAWHEGKPESGNAIAVPLYCVAPAAAEELARARGLPTTDIALWEKQYALLFIDTGQENEQTVRMCFADDNDLYARCMGYLDDLDSVKHSIDEV